MYSYIRKQNKVISNFCYQLWIFFQKRTADKIKFTTASVEWAARQYYGKLEKKINRPFRPSLE